MDMVYLKTTEKYRGGNNQIIVRDADTAERLVRAEHAVKATDEEIKNFVEVEKRRAEAGMQKKATDGKKTKLTVNNQNATAEFKAMVEEATNAFKVMVAETTAEFKAMVEQSENDLCDLVENPEIAEVVKRGRGRPPKTENHM